MAIEMIEHSDLPAASFNDGGYVENYSTKNNDLLQKTEGEYANFSINNISLVGTIIGISKDKKALKRDESNIAIISGVNKAYPVPGDNCEALLDMKTKIDNELYKVNQEILAGDSAKSKADYVNALNARNTLIKNKIDSLKCIEIAEAAELEKNKKETLEVLEKAKKEGIPQNPNEKLNKYIVWGIAGVMVVAAIIILLKKKSTP
jgi:hypothetical protein